ncbi:MAG: hypothetical protein ACUVT9_05420 [Candidatus Bathycorpusculaceae bacterium]
MKASSEYSEKGETSIIPLSETKTLFPVQFEIYVEKWRETGNIRQYIVIFSWREDSFQVTGEGIEEVLWKFGKLLLALLGETEQ